MRPENKLSNGFSIMSSKVTHNRFSMVVKDFLKMVKFMDCCSHKGPSFTDHFADNLLISMVLE